MRISNALFGRHVRDVPGGEDFMRTAGWRVQVVNMERYWVFEGVPGAPSWVLLEAAGCEVDKVERVVAGKLSVRYSVQLCYCTGTRSAGALCRARGPALSEATPRLFPPMLQRAVEDKKAATERRLEEVRLAMEDDRAQRALRVQAHAEKLVAVQAQNEQRALEEAELLRQQAAEARAEREQQKKARLSGGGSGSVSPR